MGRQEIGAHDSVEGEMGEQRDEEMEKNQHCSTIFMSIRDMDLKSSTVTTTTGNVSDLCKKSTGYKYHNGIEGIMRMSWKVLI